MNFKLDAGSTARTVILIIALINQALTSFGLNPLPFSDSDIYNYVTAIFTIVTAIIAWRKENKLKKKGDTNASK